MFDPVNSNIDTNVYKLEMLLRDRKVVSIKDGNGRIKNMYAYDINKIDACMRVIDEIKKELDNNIVYRNHVYDVIDAIKETISKLVGNERDVDVVVYDIDYYKADVNVVVSIELNDSSIEVLCNNRTVNNIMDVIEGGIGLDNDNSYNKRVMEDFKEVVIGTMGLMLKSKGYEDVDIGTELASAVLGLEDMGYKVSLVVSGIVVGELIVCKIDKC